MRERLMAGWRIRGMVEGLEGWHDGWGEGGGKARKEGGIWGCESTLGIRFQKKPSAGDGWGVFWFAFATAKEAKGNNKMCGCRVCVCVWAYVCTQMGSSCMCTHVSKYLCMNACTWEYTHVVFMSVCAWVHLFTCSQACVQHVHICETGRVYVHLCLCAHVHMCACMCIEECACACKCAYAARMCVS